MNSPVQVSPSPRLRTREFLVAGTVFTALTVIFTYPLSLDAGRVVLGDNPDTHLFIWTFGWIAETLVRAPLGLFDANIFYPLGRALAFSENLIGSGLIAAPVIWATGNPVLAMDVVSLLSVPLSAWARISSRARWASASPLRSSAASCSRSVRPGSPGSGNCISRRCNGSPSRWRMPMRIWIGAGRATPGWRPRSSRSRR
ncbi:MAG TPA: hypothetical protein VNJ03_01580 [Vicinamibacterales bacterium]|nr:hypothetical protein [Vicinamibacterales bacterium]